MSVKGIKEGFLGGTSTLRVQGAGTYKRVPVQETSKVVSTQSFKHKYTTQHISRLCISWLSEKSVLPLLPHAIQQSIISSDGMVEKNSANVPNKLNTW